MSQPINTSSENLSPLLSRDERTKQLMQRYSKFETQLSQDRETEVTQALSELAREIEEITDGKLTDPLQIQVLFGIYLPKYFKIIVQRKYMYYEIEKQLIVTQFINIWMKCRIPSLRYFFGGKTSGGEKDRVHSEIGFGKELEIIEILFNKDSDYYNFRISKNTPDVEDRLARIQEGLAKLPEDTLTEDKLLDAYNFEVAKIKRPTTQSYFYVHNINVFSKYKGFEGLLHLITQSGIDSLPLAGKASISMLKVCFQVMTVLSNMKGYLIDSFWIKEQTYGQKIAHACFDFVQSRCSQEDLRTAQKKDIQYFSNNVESILESVTIDNTTEERSQLVYKISETLDLELALKCLKVPVLEKKLIGHQLLMNQIYKVRISDKQAKLNPEGKKQEPFNITGIQPIGSNKKWLTIDLLLQWLDQNKVFDLVFGDSLHSEVIKKSYAFLEFMYINGKIQRRELNKMWECATKKHEAYKVAILKALSFLATKAKIEDLNYLFTKLKAIPLPEIDKFCLDLIKAIAKMVAGDVSQSFGSPLRGQRDILKHKLIGPELPPTAFLQQRSNSGDRQTSKQDKKVWKIDQRLNNSFSNGTHELIVMKRNKSSPRANEKEQLLNQNATLFDFENKKVQTKNATPPGQIREQDRPSTQQMNQDLNPLEVPLDKEDKRTADEDISFNDSNNQNNMDSNIFNTSMRDETQAQQTAQLKQQSPVELEEEKEDPFNSGNKASLLLNINKILIDQTLGIDDLEKRSLAHQILDYLWMLCQESSVSQHDLAMPIHKQAIEELTHLLTFNYHKAVISFIGRCVGCLQLNTSVMSMHVILQKLIINIHYPIDQSLKPLPTNRLELISALDYELNLTNVCLSSYIEFKRLSLNYIFDQMGSQEHEQENLETQSSLDNDDERSNSTVGQQQQMSVQNHLGRIASGVERSNNNINILQTAQAAGNTPQSVHESSMQKDLIHIQDDAATVQSSGSLFVSPRMKIEEEFKIPKSNRTQSFREEGVLNIQKVQNNEFGAMNPLKDSDIFTPIEQNQSSNIVAATGLMQTSSGNFQTGTRHFNSQSKKNTGFQAQLRGDIGVQQNLSTNQHFRMDQNESQLQPGAPAVQVQQQNALAQNSQANVNRDFLNSLLTNEVYKYSYYEELHLRLDFLKFLVGSCPSILKAQQLQILWECLVINAYYEKERDQFFNWCTQILKASQSIPSRPTNNTSQDIASESIFNDDCMELLFFDALLKIDFRYITEIMYDCFERYFIYINEQYGQIVSNSAFDSAFEVFETKLIGIEALWEILLCSRNTKVYRLATEFLHKIYKKMSPTLGERLNEIKEDLLQICMSQIKTGYNEIRAQIGGTDGLYDVPIYQLSMTFEDPKNRIARSISQLCKFIDEFEGLRDKSAKSQLGGADKEIKVIGNNKIGNPPTPKKIELTVPLTTKIGQIREEFAKALFPKRQSKELSLINKGKELNEDFKTLKDLGQGQNDVLIFISLRTQFELDIDANQGNLVQDESAIQEKIGELKMFMEDIQLPDSVLKLAIQKCNLNLEEVFMMITDEEKINDLQEEVRRNEEASANNNIVMIEDAQEDVQEDSKLNLIISNRSEYFDLLFELLNLGINEITNAAWNLLIQIPVNKTLLHQIRTLSTIADGNQNNWSQIIDPANAYKMLYSIQIVNSLISVNNEKLSEAEIQERYEWRLRFLELGGFEHLYSILITAEPDEFLTANNQNNRISQTQIKKKSKAPLKMAIQVPESQTQGINQENQQIQNNQAKCLGYLISIVKIFIQAALLTTDEEKLLTLIVQSSTSPYRKPKTMKSALQSVPQSKFNQIMFGSGPAQIAASLSETSKDENSRENSSIYTPKFQSSHSSTPQCQTPNPNEKEGISEGKDKQNKSIDTAKAETIFSQQTMGGAKGNENQLYTQVDDFPRLMEQISGPIAQNLLEKVVNFNGLISKLLNIIYKAVMFCDSPEVSSLVQNSLDLLLPCIVWRPQLLLKEIFEFDNLESLLIRTLMHNSNENVRKSIEKTFKTICYETIEDESVLQPKVHVLRILLKNLPDVDIKSDYCEEYFNLLTHLMKQCQANFKLPQESDVLLEEAIQNLSSRTLKNQFLLDDGMFSALSIFQWCIYQLKMRPKYEDRYSQYTDKVLAGYLQLTQSVLEINQSLKKLTRSGQSGYDLVKTVFDFLFLLPSMEDQQLKHQKNLISQQDSHPKCKRKLTRKKAFNLLLTLCQHQDDNFVQLLQELYVFHTQIQKSQQVVSLADFDNEVGMRSASGYVGLKNFGCTCYMNALIQQLFMMPDFRQRILESEVRDSDFENNVLYQLKHIFANLQESEKQYYAPTGFTKAFKFYGEAVNVRQQQDTHEFFNLLCDNIDNILKDTPYAHLLKETVGGVIGNETRSMEEEYQYLGESDESFFAISLDIKNKKSLSEALDLYIKPDHLEGDNKYFCEKHNRKIVAQRRSYLKTLSNTVIINLKRFEFDYNSMQRFKVNDYCQFPETINFKQWTREGIREREQIQKKKQHQGGGEASDAAEQRSKESAGDAYEDGSVDEEHSVKVIDEQKLEADPIDEDLESGDDEVMIVDEQFEGQEDIDNDDEEEEGENINSVMNTGKYFDEGVMEDFIDIAADDDIDSQNKRTLSGQGINIQKQKGPQSSKQIEESKDEQSNNKSKKRSPQPKLNQEKKVKQIDNSYYEFELVGVLVHSGSADAGHYYSFIKDRQAQGNRWLEFNDTNVREFDYKNLGVECFGGDQKQNSDVNRGLLYDFTPADARLFERCRNAYLLIYERIQPIKSIVNEKTNEEQLRKHLMNGIEKSVYQRIWDENAAFMKLKIFFDQEYFSFARDYINLYNFENVLFFGPENSSTYKLKQMIELTEQFLIKMNTDLDSNTLNPLFLMQQNEISMLSKRSEDFDIFSTGIFAGVTLKEKISQDPGLHAIKLATILSQDIITKMKDVQSFVQWMQMMDSLYERHAVACVWYLKYITENKNILEELLLENHNFEIRESFGKLLVTVISVVTKNEESYIFKTDDVLQINYGSEQNQVLKLSVSRSAVARFMEIFFCDNMLDKVLRVNWRRFDEYFQVLASISQINFEMTKYLINKQNAIIRLLEFIMNCSSPFYSSTKLRMGDKQQEPNFTSVVDVLSILIRCCFTDGIKRVQQYSPQSITMFQEAEHHIAFPFDNQSGNRFPLFSKDCFTYHLIVKANPNNESLSKMIVHLCWGDIDNSIFIINELMESIRNRADTRDLQYHLNVLKSLMLLNDEFQTLRLNEVFSFESQATNTIFQGAAIGFNSSKSIFKQMQNRTTCYSNDYTLPMLKYFGSLAIEEDKSQAILNYMRSKVEYYQDWVQKFLLKELKTLENRPEYSQAGQIRTCADLYKQIFDNSSSEVEQDVVSGFATNANPETTNYFASLQNNTNAEMLHQIDQDFDEVMGSRPPYQGKHSFDGDN